MPLHILKSLSNKEEIKSIKNLYKIGFSTMSPEERIKNASQEPSYLMAPVKIMAVFKCFNMNPQKLELLLHKFFGSACLNIDVFDNKGKCYRPREWFIAPLDIMQQAIDFILNEKIIHYYYDLEKEKILTTDNC